MRLKVILNGNGKILPFSNQHMLNGYFHKCLGEGNKYHDALSDYSVSMLCGGTTTEDKSGLIFEDKAYFVVSSMDEVFMSEFLIGLYKNQSFQGMELLGIEPINEKFYEGVNFFRALTPILLKSKTAPKKYTFLTIDDDNYKDELKKSIIRKLTQCSFVVPESFDIEISEIGKQKRTVMVGNVKNVGNIHEIVVIGPKYIAEAIYNIGIGNSSGSGFGTIYNSKNRHLYGY